MKCSVKIPLKLPNNLFLFLAEGKIYRNIRKLKTMTYLLNICRPCEIYGISPVLHVIIALQREGTNSKHYRGLNIVKINNWFPTNHVF